MKFLTAAWYEFLKNVRDVKMLAFMVVFPVVVSYLIGTAVQGFFQPDDGKAIRAAVVNLDGGAVGRGFDEFIRSGAVAERLKADAYPTPEQGRQALADGACTVLIVVPAGLTEDVTRGRARSIEVSGGEGVEFARTLAGSFASSFNAALAVAEAGGRPAEPVRAEAVVRVNRTATGGYPDLIDYYAVLVLLQSLIIGSILGAQITAGQYGSDIHIRTHALPVRPWVLLTGRIVGSAAYLMLTSAATILFTKAAYGVDWGGNVPLLAATVAVFCFIVVGIGVICGRVFRKLSTAVMAIFVLMFFFGTVSGSVSPKSGITALGFLSPNYYAKVLLFGSMYGYPEPVMVSSALWLLGMAAAVFLAVALLMGRVRHDNL